MTRARRLPRAFYARPAEELARDLLGKFLVRRLPDGDARAAGRIVEVEAYVGPHDLACHAARGLTGRTKVMFGPPGHAYVYLIYGRNRCFNVVCEGEGFPAAVLVRALEPAEGVTLPTHRRTRQAQPRACHHPGRQHPRPHRRHSLAGDRGGPVHPIAIVATPRIGIDYAGEWVAAPLRFVDAKSAWLPRRIAGSPRASSRAPLLAPPRRTRPR